MYGAYKRFWSTLHTHNSILFNGPCSYTHLPPIGTSHAGTLRPRCGIEPAHARKGYLDGWGREAEEGHLRQANERCKLNSSSVEDPAQSSSAYFYQHSS